jgi:flagellar basal-body rod protein FlgF
MEGQIYAALSAQLALERQIDTVANNLANSSTPGFKADRQQFQTYISRLHIPGNELALVRGRGSFLELTAGAIEKTDNPLDVAIQGDGFFAVQTSSGIGYTRNGRLHLSPDGTLVDDKGQPILDDSGSPIQLPESYSHLQIKGDGTINAWVDGASQDIARIATFRPADPRAVSKLGDGMFDAGPGGMLPIPADDPASRLVQGGIESSTVQPVLEIANMTSLSRSYETLANLITADDQREQQMIDTLGRPS